MKNAQHYVKSYRRFVIVGLLVLLVFWLVLFNVVFQKSFLGLLFAYALLGLAVLVLKFYATSKWLKSPLINDLDASLYYEIITTGKFYDRTAMVYLQAEYFTGHYENVIAICNQMLAKPKIRRRFYYTYITYLANVCYNIGDRENLQKICQQARGFFADEKPRVKKRCARIIKRLQFYDDYLEQNWDACENYLSESAGTTALMRTINAYNKAHVALAKGEIDKAKVYFEEVQKAQGLFYAAHATHALEAIKADRPYSEGIEPVSENKEYALKLFPKKLKVLYGICLVLGVLYVLSTGLHSFENLKYKSDICKAVEQDYDDAKVLKTFDLTYDGEIADSMALCEVYEGLLLASIYTYEGEDQIYYHEQALIEAHELKNDKLKTQYNYFTCVVSDARAVVAFCTEERDIPEDALYSFSVKAHRKTVYVSVVFVGEEYPFS